MKAVILAAGISSRLRPLTDSTPKCLLKVGNRPILGCTMAGLLSNGISEFLIVTGYREGQIRDYVAHTFPGVSVSFLRNDLYASTNNIYSLWLTRPHLLHQDIMLLDSDILFDDRIIGLLRHSGYESCLAVTSAHALGDEEIKVQVTTDGSIIQIGKEVNPASAAGESIGIEMFGSETFSALSEILERKIVVERMVNVFYEAAFQELIDQGKKVFAVDVGSYPCMEIDTHEDLDKARQRWSGF